MELMCQLSAQLQERPQSASLAESPIVIYLWVIPLKSHCSASYNSGTTAWSVAGGGADIWNQADQFNLARRGLTGDGTVTAQTITEGQFARG